MTGHHYSLCLLKNPALKPTQIPSLNHWAFPTVQTAGMFGKFGVIHQTIAIQILRILMVSSILPNFFADHF